MRYDVSRQADNRSMLDYFFGNDFLSPVLTNNASWSPAVDIVEKEDRYFIKADIPGVNEKDINIELKDNILTISGERHSEVEDEKEGVKRCERTYGSFSRSFRVNDIAEDKIDASYDNGILTLELLKKEEVKAKKIEVRAKH